MANNVDCEMRCRRIVLDDGRYLIFYTFDDAPRTASNEPQNPKSKAQREE